MSDEQLTLAQNKVRAAAETAYRAAETHHAAETLRNYYAAWESLLRLYFPLPTPTAVARPLPPDLAAQLQGMFLDLSRGIVPPILALVQDSGRNARSREEERDISAAVSYIHAVNDGLIEDRSPVKSICEKFGVARTTVQGWLAKIEPEKFASEERLLDAVDEAANRYQVAGRSNKATLKRGAKRTPK